MESRRIRDLDEKDFYAEAFSRNIGLLTPEEQERLRTSTVAIVGVGGVGGIEAAGFARLGVGGFRLADPDTVELANFNRQAVATASSIGRTKASVAVDMIRDINPFAGVVAWERGVDEGNIDGFLEGADILIDAVDFFSPLARRTIYAAAKKRGIYAIGAGPVGFGSALVAFSPDGMDFDDYFGIADGMDEKEMSMRFGLGLTPSLLQRRYFHPKSVDFDGKAAPSLSIGTYLAAGLVLTESVKALLGRPVTAVPHAMHFDAYLGRLKRTYMPFGNRGPIQRAKFAAMRYIMKER